MSGLLYESNLMMYDRQSESLWSQSLGEAVVGERTGQVLDILPMQVLAFEDVAQNYPGASVLSTDTGHSREYGRNPYSGYESSDELLIDVTVHDGRFELKEPMYVFRLGETSFALPYADVSAGRTSVETVEGTVDILLDGQEVFVYQDGERIPGYIEMWFSWVTQHQDDGEVIAVE